MTACPSQTHRVAPVARTASHVVRSHLTQAALSLPPAVQWPLEEPAEPAGCATPVEQIDLTEE